MAYMSDNGLVVGLVVEQETPILAKPEESPKPAAENAAEEPIKPAPKRTTKRKG